MIKEVILKKIHDLHLILNIVTELRLCREPFELTVNEVLLVGALSS